MKYITNIYIIYTRESITVLCAAVHVGFVEFPLETHTMTTICDRRARAIVDRANVRRFTRRSNN